MDRREFLKNATAGVAVSTIVSSVGLEAGLGQQAAGLGTSSKPITIDAYCTLGVDREYNLTDSSLLRAMDKAGVEWAVIAPPDRFLAIYNREGNESIRKAASGHKNRLIPACSVNPWYGKAAVEELKRALGNGARVVVLHPFVQGFLANDELVFPVIEEAVRENVPVYIHTGPPGNATPWKIVDLADRYRTADFIIGHCGATDFWNDMIGALSAAPNVYGESSLARPFLFTSYIESVGSKKGVVGSWAPINDLVFEWEEMRKFMPKESQPDVCGNNMYALLRKRGPLWS